MIVRNALRRMLATLGGSALAIGLPIFPVVGAFPSWISAA